MLTPMIADSGEMMLHDETGQFIRDKGWEYGTATGRPRRIVWLDFLTIKYAMQVNGLTGLAFTRLDTLSGVAKVKICTHYELSVRMLSLPPSSYTEIGRFKPVYQTFDGWEDIGAEKNGARAPRAASIPFPMRRRRIFSSSPTMSTCPFT
ncbi:MAG: Adenylosuccinate synthetase [Methanosaeta sp. PtaU1.Bin112]|nr:MAG: Adenylosuccinate synthetase [Methanosaeta sp. PtaU1.Bin112]